MSRRKTFSQRARRTFRKASLAAVFLSVAGGEALAAETPWLPPPSEIEITLAEAKARMPAAEYCAANSNQPEMELKTPRLARDMEVLSQLPLTGRPVYNVVTDPANGFQSCIFPADPKQGSRSTYSQKVAKIASNSDGLTTAHEYFHALQDMNGGNDGFYRLTLRDAVVDNLLQEASAVAYEMAARREASNRGLSFYRPPAVLETRADGTVTTWYFLKASTDLGNIAAFREAYDKAWLLNAAADARTREEKSLEAGGQAVVRRLMSGEDRIWSSVYLNLAARNANANGATLSFNSRVYSLIDSETSGYPAKRDAAFKKMGAVSANINFIPAEFLGPDAERHIDKCFTDLGFRDTGVAVERITEKPAVKIVRAPASPRPPVG